MTTPFILTAGLSVLTLAACVAGAATTPGGDTARGPQPMAATACALDLTEAGGMLTLTARVQSAAATTGSYSLIVRGDGASINQGGPFALAAGESKSLSEVALSSRPGPLNAQLTVEIGGRSMTCPVT
jgi:hypothetical protein